jgi:nucleoside-diphosphate-sugar epimerase
MTKTILITGGIGFIGKQVVRVLSEQELSLRLVVRRGNKNLVPSYASNAELIETDDLFSESVEWWADQCAGVDTVVHLAWYAEPGNYLQSQLNIDCLQGSLNLARGAIQAAVRRFVGVGTCFEYDLSAGVLSVDTPLKPSTPYADAKVALFMSLSHWLPMRSVEFAWCRLFYLYGAGEDSRRLVPYLRTKLENEKPAALTSGKQIRDFLDVAEAGAMIVDVALSRQAGTVNICSGVPITVRQLAEQIADEYGRRDLLLFGARPDNLIDPPCVVGIPNIQTEKLIS